MRLRLIDRVRRYIRPGPGGSRSRGSTRPGPPVGGWLCRRATGRPASSRPRSRARARCPPAAPVSTAMTDGAGALDGSGGSARASPAGGVAAPGTPRPAGRAGPAPGAGIRSRASRSGPGRPSAGPPGRGQRARADTGPAERPWPPGRAGAAPARGTAAPRPGGPWTPRSGGRSRCRRTGPAGPGAPGPGRHARKRASPGRDGRREPARTGTAGRRAGTGTERGPAGTAWTGTPARTSRPGQRRGSAATAGTGATRAAGRPAGQDRAAIRPAPGHALPRRAASGRAAKGAASNDARARSGPAADAARGVAGESARPAEADAARLPWYEVAHAKRAAEGYQNCGPLERVLRREWPPSKVPSAPVVRAVNRLAELPLMIKQILAAGVDAIHVGEGGVPELDDMARLRGVPLPSGRATWDACAGAYGERKIIVGSRPSSAPDVMCHEVGHALDDIDREQGRWQSDSDRVPPPVPALRGITGERLPPAARRSGPPGVLRRRVRRDRLPPAPGAGGHARRQHPDRS